MFLLFRGKKVNEDSCELALVAGYEEPKDNLNDRYKCIPLASFLECHALSSNYQGLMLGKPEMVQGKPGCQEIRCKKLNQPFACLEQVNS